VFSSDGCVLATLSKHDVFLWDLKSGRQNARARPFRHPASASFSPSGEFLAVKNTSGRIAVLSARDGTIVSDFRNFKNGEGSRIRFSACGESSSMLPGWGGCMSGAGTRVRRSTLPIGRER
jgi:WD40 repeat protein